MNNTELLAALRKQMNSLAGVDNDEIASDRQAAQDYYFMRPNGTEIDGRSTSVSGDVSAMVEANLAAIMEAFGEKRIVEFDSLDGEDEDQAQLESDAVAYYVMGKNNGRWQLAQAIKEILLLRNGWIKVWTEEEKTASVREFRNVGEDALGELLDQPDCRVIAYDKASGYLKLRCITTTKRFRCEAVATENILYPKAYDGCDFAAMQRIPALYERHVEPRSELVKRGFSRAKVDALTAYRNDTNPTAVARNPRRDATLGTGTDKSSELVEWYEVQALVEGSDGISERQKICTDSKFKSMLLRESSRLVGYATGQAFIAPFRLTGISVWDKIRQNQDNNTGLQRALEDNVQATSKNRVAVLDGKVNPDDVADGRVNGQLRVKPSVARVSDAVMPFAVPDTSAGIVAAMQQQRMIRTELGGSTLDMQGGQLQVSKQVGSMGLDRAFSVAEQLAAHITQNIADTLIRSVFLIAHAELRANFTDPVPVKRNGRWESATPSQWRQREELTVKPGMSPGERARQAATLDKMLQTQIQLHQLGEGDILVDREGFYALLMDWARVSGVPNPERYYIDPESDASKETADAKSNAAQTQQQQQQQLVAQAVQLEKLKQAFEKYKTDADNAIKVWQEKAELRFKYWDADLKAQVAEGQHALAAAVQVKNGQRAEPDADDGTEEAGRAGSQGEPAATADAE
jgi:hypothetical protein